MKRKYSCNKNNNHNIDVNSNLFSGVQNGVQSVQIGVQSVQIGVQNVNQSVHNSVQKCVQSVQSNNKTYKCLHCNKTYLSSQALSKHKNKHTENIENINNSSFDDLLNKYNQMEDEMNKLKDIINKQSNELIIGKTNTETNTKHKCH
jgi:hypothetical protein